MKKHKKLITFTIPCYNSEEYMRHSIDSILIGGEDVEIIIIDDGSTKDKTAEIADEYQEKYPTICRAVHQENGGHGAGVNMGIKLATGKYFKVVDSDDWVDEIAYRKIIEQLKEFETSGTNIDLLICNYVYEKVTEGIQKVVNYKKALPSNQLFSWDDIGYFGPNEFFIMHSLIYKTQVLWDSKVELPKHTFYVDSIFATIPLKYTRNLYYMPVDFYRYYIGRDDQSVNTDILMKRIDQYILVNTIICENLNIEETDAISPKLTHYIYRFIRILSLIATIFLKMSGTEENEQKRKDYWAMIKRIQPKLYPRIRLYMGNLPGNLPGPLGPRIASKSYDLSKVIFKFN
ncbi:MAG: glycosyltransferase family 2 protein [Spirochaetaceae bacterium]|nr:glycosyltransferase family 2 protein [Spirochaetaceae bacterium]